MTSQPGDYHLEWMCALSDDVRTGWPRPGADRRASLRRRPDDGRATRQEGRGPRGGVPYAAPTWNGGPEPHFSHSR
jgi:hypothetical protein